jgi:hypothetical protein
VNEDLQEALRALLDGAVDEQAQELRARIETVLDPAWGEAARATLEERVAPILEQLQQLMPAMKPGDALELVDGRVVLRREST